MGDITINVGGTKNHVTFFPCSHWCLVIHTLQVDKFVQWIYYIYVQAPRIVGCRYVAVSMAARPRNVAVSMVAWPLRGVLKGAPRGLGCSRGLSATGLAVAPRTVAGRHCTWNHVARPHQIGHNRWKGAPWRKSSHGASVSTFRGGKRRGGPNPAFLGHPLWERHVAIRGNKERRGIYNP